MQAPMSAGKQHWCLWTAAALRHWGERRPHINRYRAGVPRRSARRGTDAQTTVGAREARLRDGSQEDARNRVRECVPQGVAVCQAKSPLFGRARTLAASSCQSKRHLPWPDTMRRPSWRHRPRPLRCTRAMSWGSSRKLRLMNTKVATKCCDSGAHSVGWTRLGASQSSRPGSRRL